MSHSLQQFKTIAFEFDIMRQCIQFGWRSVKDPKRPWIKEEFVLDLGMWIDGVVPQCYRATISEMAVLIFDQYFRGYPYRGNESRDGFIAALREEIFSHLEAIMP